MEAPILGVPSATLEPVLANYWHLDLYAHPRLPELLIAGRERAYLAEFFRPYGNIDVIGDSALDEYARHLAFPGKSAERSEFTADLRTTCRHYLA